MWLKGKYMAHDKQGRGQLCSITINLNLAIGFVALDEERTRVYFAVGHDLEDYAHASFLDLTEPKSKLDSNLHKARKDS